MTMMKLEYSKMREEFKGNEMMLDCIENLQEFEEFHYLLASDENMKNNIVSQYSIKNEQLEKWLKYCDGGLLFDTVLLSKQAYDKEKDLEFDSYDDYNKDKETYGLDEKFCIIGFRSYGDIICVNTEEHDNKVYLLNVETGEFDDIWDSFTDWITEEIDDAIKLIGEEALDPLPAKLEG